MQEEKSRQTFASSATAQDLDMRTTLSLEEALEDSEGAVLKDKDGNEIISLMNALKFCQTFDEYSSPILGIGVDYVAAQKEAHWTFQLNHLPIIQVGTKKNIHLQKEIF